MTNQRTWTAMSIYLGNPRISLRLSAANAGALQRNAAKPTPSPVRLSHGETGSSLKVTSNTPTAQTFLTGLHQFPHPLLTTRPFETGHIRYALNRHASRSAGDNGFPQPSSSANKDPENG